MCTQRLLITFTVPPLNETDLARPDAGSVLTKTTMTTMEEKQDESTMTGRPGTVIAYRSVRIKHDTHDASASVCACNSPLRLIQRWWGGLWGCAYAKAGCQAMLRVSCSGPESAQHVHIHEHTRRHTVGPRLEFPSSYHYHQPPHQIHRRRLELAWPSPWFHTMSRVALSTNSTQLTIPSSTFLRSNLPSFPTSVRIATAPSSA